MRNIFTTDRISYFIVLHNPLQKKKKNRASPQLQETKSILKTLYCHH